MDRYSWKVVWNEKVHNDLSAVDKSTAAKLLTGSRATLPDRLISGNLFPDTWQEFSGIAMVITGSYTFWITQLRRSPFWGWGTDAKFIKISAGNTENMHGINIRLHFLKITDNNKRHSLFYPKKHGDRNQTAHIAKNKRLYKQNMCWQLSCRNL